MGTNAQQFCLKWNNHQANMLSVFDRLLSNKSLVDVTIGCEGRQVKAHKVVLSACSPFFENLFTENPCKHPIVILKDIRYADLTALVEFMYKGEVNVIQEQLPTLLKTAEALKIKGLAEVTGDSGKSDDKPHASVTPRPESPGSRRKRQRVRRKSTDSAAGGGGHSDSEESMPKASRTEHDDSSMDGATSLDDGSQASLQHQQTPSKQTSAQDALKDPSIVQSNNAVTVNNSPSSAPAHNNATNSTSNGPNSSSKDADFEPTRLLEASMTTDHGADNSTDLTNSTGPDNNSIVHDGLDIKPIITLEEGATPAGAIVPATTPSLPTGADAISSLFPQGTGATALPGTSYQASPQSHDDSLWRYGEHPRARQHLQQQQQQQQRHRKQQQHQLQLSRRSRHLRQQQQGHHHQTTGHHREVGHLSATAAVDALTDVVKYKPEYDASLTGGYPTSGQPHQIKFDQFEGFLIPTSLDDDDDDIVNMDASNWGQRSASWTAGGGGGGGGGILSRLTQDIDSTLSRTYGTESTAIVAAAAAAAASGVERRPGVERDRDEDDQENDEDDSRNHRRHDGDDNDDGDDDDERGGDAGDAGGGGVSRDDATGEVFYASSRDELRSLADDFWRKGRLSCCKLCPYETPRSEHMYRHIRSVHRASRQYPCGRCGKKFSRKDYATNHARTCRRRCY